MSSFIFDIQKIMVEHNEMFFPIYVLSFSLKGSDKWVILGASDNCKKVYTMLEISINLDSEFLKKTFDYKCERVIRHFETEFTKKENNGNIEQNNKKGGKEWK